MPLIEETSKVSLIIFMQILLFAFSNVYKIITTPINVFFKNKININLHIIHLGWIFIINIYIYIDVQRVMRWLNSLRRLLH